MNLEDRLRFGYWPSRQLNGEIPNALREPHEYSGSDILNIACTQTGLSSSQQKRLVKSWVDILPSVKASTIVFSSKVSPELFEAACLAPNLQALNIKWSSLDSLEAIRKATKLNAIFLGSSPKIKDLSPLSDLIKLRWLFIENTMAPINLSFLYKLNKLREFGISASRGKKLLVEDLEPIASLKCLEMLWLISIRIERGNLKPLESLSNLISFRSTLRQNSKEFQSLCSALPKLQYFQPVG